MSYVYVIGPHNGPYKIGMTGNLSKRLSALQISTYQRLNLVHFVETETAEYHEQCLHRALAKHNVMGEWFDCELNEILSAFAVLGLVPLGEENMKLPPCPIELKPMTGEQFSGWVKEMSKWSFVRCDADLITLLDSTDEEFNLMKANGCDVRTALACRALYHNMPPYGMKLEMLGAPINLKPSTLRALSSLERSA